MWRLNQYYNAGKCLAHTQMTTEVSNYIYGHQCKKKLVLGFANIKGIAKPAHPHRLIALLLFASWNVSYLHLVQVKFQCFSWSLKLMGLDWASLCWKLIVRVCNCSMFCCTLLYVHSSIAIILMGKRERWLLCLICLPGVSWWLSSSSSRCYGVVSGWWLWYFHIKLTYFFLLLSCQKKVTVTPCFVYKVIRDL